MRKLALKGKPLSERVLKSKVFGACPGHNYNYNKEIESNYLLANWNNTPQEIHWLRGNVD